MLYFKKLSVAVALLISIWSPLVLSSECYGTYANGRITGAVALPERGKNFRAYSSWGVEMQRNFVHIKVRDSVLAAYQKIHTIKPAAVFVYGETGFPQGGPFTPHRTHQNGLSVDFMVPVINAAGISVDLPTSEKNRYGYDWEFDATGQAGELKIDFELLALHLAVLNEAARKQGVGIKRVILHPPYIEKLRSTRYGKQLSKIAFMQTEAWVKHDEHYHVDFDVPCRK